MARGHHHRFGKLHEQLKASGYSATAGASGEFLKFLQGTNKLTVARKPAAAMLKLYNVAVVPFGKNPLATTTTTLTGGYETTWTGQAYAIQNAFLTIAPIAAFGITTDLSKAEIYSGFESAEAHVTVKNVTETTKTAKTSQITKRAYKTFTTRTGAIPYGRVAGLDQEGTTTKTTIADCPEEAVRASLINKLKGKDNGTLVVTGVTFSDEDWILHGITGISVPTAVPSVTI